MRPERPELEPGVVVAGRYVIRAPLGRGGFGSVYRATHRDLGEDVAIKVLERGLAKDRVVRERFLSEVRLTQAVVHKHAVRLRDFGHDDALGCLYFTMDLIEGETLGRILARERRLSERRAVGIASQVLDVLAEAHAAGLVHRDVKPANVMVVRDREGGDDVRVLDFGIAKAISASRSRVLAALTATGTAVGTPGYMSPEHVLGRKLDGRSDVFSVGVVLYEMLSGRLPHEPEPGADDARLSLATSVLTKPARDLAEVAPSVSAGVRAAVMRALEREPDARFADARALERALAAALADPGRTVASLETGAISRVPASTPASARATPSRHEPSRDDVPIVAPSNPARRSLVLASAIVAVAAVLGATALLAMELPPRTGLVVRTHPEGARVVLDGKLELGHAPVALLRVAPGEHEVEATLAGYAPERSHVHVVRGERTELVLELARLALRPSPPIATRPAPAPLPRPARPAPRPHRGHVDPFDDDDPEGE